MFGWYLTWRSELNLSPFFVASFDNSHLSSRGKGGTMKADIKVTVADLHFLLWQNPSSAQEG
ncbi:unnamed protein product [Timema podura]|uniref:Uncharacterized protein n=1 Tax=Timema podura TaxID=61482 RepID=A0ABN7PSN7_TIMPD|nr:unnamed protein product [Timema podura]